MGRIGGILLVLGVVGAFALDDTGLDPKQQVGSAIAEVREQGCAALGEQGDTAAAKLLIGLLGDPDWGVQMAAIRALGPIRFEPGKQALYDSMRDGEIHGVRMQAARMLHEYDAQDAAERIDRDLKRYKEDVVRPRLIEALGIIGGDAAAATLEKLMRAPEPADRIAAACALARVHAGEKALLRALGDREDEVRLRALLALATIDSDDARDAVLDTIEKGRGDWDGYLLRHIGRAGAEANGEALTAALVERLPKTKQPGALLRIARAGKLTGCAAAARGRLRERQAADAALAFQVATSDGKALDWEDVRRGVDSKEAILQYAASHAYLAGTPTDLADRLRRLLGHKEGEVVMVAVRRIVADGSRELLDELGAVARGETACKKEWMARVTACVALGRVGQRASFDALVELAGARDWWLRAAALEGLYHTFDERAIPIMIAAFDDQHPVARATARRNLRYLSRTHHATKQLAEQWWEKWKGNYTLTPPDEYETLAQKYGYAKHKYITEALRGTDIVAIEGRWDRVQKILEDLEVQHQAIRQQQIKDFGLSPKQVVLVNCEGSVDSYVTQYLQWFVVAGGYMATTDWSLVNAVDRTFPGVVKGWTKQSTGNDVVVIEPAAPGHPTLDGVFRDGVDLMWWLEIQAFPIDVVDPVRGTVLVDSFQMLTRYGSSAMMVEWPAGLGKVLHSTSHFFLQKEGFAHETDPRARMVFAADHLGLDMEEIREIRQKGVFDNVNDTTPISKSYSMFRMLVNFIEEKRKIDRTG